MSGFPRPRRSSRRARRSSRRSRHCPSFCWRLRSSLDMPSNLRLRAWYGNVPRRTDRARPPRRHAGPGAVDVPRGTEGDRHPPAPTVPHHHRMKGHHAMASVLHVATTGSDAADGSEASPLRTINRAAAIARPGDTVVVHGGEYREWVTPRRGGLSDQRRITYEAAAGEHVVIKGSEVVTGWEHYGGGGREGGVPHPGFGGVQPLFPGEGRGRGRLP